MAGNPQLEDGYTRIANELLEALIKACLSGQEFKIILAVFRKTFGWKNPETGKSKIWDNISYTQFQQLTGINRRSVGKVIKSLKNKNILDSSQEATSNIIRYRINKHYHTWKGISQKATSSHKAAKNSSQEAAKASSQEATHKRYIKDNKDREWTPYNFKFPNDPFMQAAWIIFSSPGYSEDDLRHHCESYGKSYDEVTSALAEKRN